jgi:membrane-associated protease RseP (regulator of RpoE activity)
MSFPTEQQPLHQEPAERAHLEHEIVPLTVDEVPPRTFPMLPVVLFLLTCYTTFGVGGMAYSFALMLTLVCHEFGHYIQARRYRVPASLPYFIPIPAPPLGTMGAVIGMRGEMGDRRALFDIGISGPLAGLVPAMIFTVWGLSLSTVVPKQPSGMLGDPLLFKFLVRQFFGVLPANQDVLLHPLAYAGWVGVLITSLNLMPIGQLDGGHILYAMLRRKAHVVAWALLVGAVTAVVLMHSYQWTLMLLLLAFMGPSHPPTADDKEPLGTPRVVLGWLTLAFVIIGFTPTPFTGF